MPFYVYMLRCVDGSFYVGQTDNLEIRLIQHENGTLKDAYTHNRRPVELMWFDEFPTRDDALNRERQIKGWTRKKKLALSNGNWPQVAAFSKGRERPGRPSTPALRASAQGKRGGGW